MRKSINVGIVNQSGFYYTCPLVVGKSFEGDIAIIADGKFLEALMDVLTDEQKVALGLSDASAAESMQVYKEEDIDWSNFYHSNSSLAGCDDDDESPHIPHITMRTLLFQAPRDFVDAGMAMGEKGIQFVKN